MGPPRRLDLPQQPSHRAALESADLPSQIDILQAMMARHGRPLPGRQHQKHVHQNHASPASPATRPADSAGGEDRDGGGASSEEERSQGMIEESSSSRSSTSGEHSTADAHPPCTAGDSISGSGSGGGGGNEGATATAARDIDLDVPDYSLLFNEARAAKTEGKAPRVVPKYGEEMADVPTKRIEMYLPPPSPQFVPKRRSGCCLPFFGRG